VMVDASSAPERGGKEHTLNSTAGNGREHPLSSRFQTDKELIASTPSSTSLDKETSLAAQLPAICAKDQSSSCHPPVAGSKRLPSYYASDDAKETPAATVTEEQVTKHGSAVLDDGLIVFYYHLCWLDCVFNVGCVSLMVCLMSLVSTVLDNGLILFLMSLMSTMFDNVFQCHLCQLC